MELKQALKILEESKEFKEWSKNNKGSFLSYAFKMDEANTEGQWQLGFYHKETDKVAPFIIGKNNVELQEEEEIFKKPETKVEPIDIKKVKLSFKEIMKKAEEFQKKHYSAELVDKTISILQNIEEYSTIWNITCVTRSFRTLNMKISPENGKIESHDISSLMDLIKK